MKIPNIQAWYYWFICQHRYPTPLMIINYSNLRWKTFTMEAITETADALGYEIKTANQISYRKKSKLPKLKIGRRIFYLSSRKVSS